LLFDGIALDVPILSASTLDGIRLEKIVDVGKTSTVARLR